ncbi:TolB family protein [Nocardioides sp. AX2bis]|uniref:TolB family protein n=1 Tax=Nocardioides sp. AX2bis TaxID=2653157 RepID=UPI00135A2B2B|nr:PD40 domain-containing protein [Nocardioides sp. AX2bis]
MIAFDSVATNLVRRDTNTVEDVFVRRLGSAVVERVSVNSGGRQADGDSDWPAVSGGGRQVVFTSSATNLVPGDRNNASDIFLRDLRARTTTLISSASDGTPGNAPSLTPTISRDGTFAAFASDATNLVAGGTPEFTRNIYVKNIRTGRIFLVSRSVGGAPLSNAAAPAVSNGGRYVSFTSFAPDVVAGDTNDQVDVFLRDRRLRETTRVSVTSAGAEGDAFSGMPAISANGQTVAFVSDATNLTSADTNARRDVFVRDVVAGTTSRVSVDSAGVQGNDESDYGIRGASVFGPSISADGQVVAFGSIASNLVPDDTNTCSFRTLPSFTLPGQCPDIFTHDRLTEATTRVSVSGAGEQADDASTDPAISGDGRSVAFFSTASNLAPGDTNTCRPSLFAGHPGQCPDVYLHTR